ncbi:MAG: RNA ligase family protein [Janthinobacterium lividum]
MDLLTKVAKTAAWVLFDNVEEILNMTIMPKVGAKVTSKVTEKFGKPASKWLIAKVVSDKGVDGIILRGLNLFRNSGAKFALRKGLPNEKERTLAIENEPHVLDGFDGEILSGYGKGTKRIVYKGGAILKVGGEARLTDVEYHVHQADKAGLHYDLAVQGLPSNQDLFELNIGKGPVRGRYSFVKTDRGYIIGRMVDRGVSIAKPKYNLKTEDFLQQIGDPKVGADYIVERKMDGSLINALIYENRVVMHSHRESAQSYYDKLPAIEFLKNRSKYFFARKLFPQPNLQNTILKAELVHPNGIGIVSGILNSSADNAVKVQNKIGMVVPYVWDIVRYRGKDLSNVPYEERRKILEEVVAEMNIFNKNWQVIEKKPDGVSPLDFYHAVVNDNRGLPYSEGVIIKPKSSVTEDAWFKVKMHDLVDMEIIDFIEGDGKYQGKLGSLLAKDLESGNTASVGTGLSDFERDWIWEHKELLQGAVIKTKVFEETKESFRAPRFVEFHESKGNNEAGLLMYADVLAGLDDKKKMIDVKHALINA